MSYMFTHIIMIPINWGAGTKSRKKIISLMKSLDLDGLEDSVSKVLRTSKAECIVIAGQFNYIGYFQMRELCKELSKLFGVNISYAYQEEYEELRCEEITEE